MPYSLTRGSITGWLDHHIRPDRGVDAKVIAEIVGHSDARLTQNVYQHVYRAAKKAAAGKMNEVLGGSAPATPEAAVATTVATKSLQGGVN